MSSEQAPADPRQHELDVLNHRMYLTGSELLKGAEVMRGLREQRDLLLADFETGVRAAIAEELRFAGERLFPRDAAGNQNFDQAARIAEIGLLEYDRENARDAG